MVLLRCTYAEVLLSSLWRSFSLLLSRLFIILGSGAGAMPSTLITPGVQLPWPHPCSPCHHSFREYSHQHIIPMSRYTPLSNHYFLNIAIFYIFVHYLTNSLLVIYLKIIFVTLKARFYFDVSAIRKRCDTKDLTEFQWPRDNYRFMLPISDIKY